jgi:hypothetical protein
LAEPVPSAKVVSTSVVLSFEVTTISVEAKMTIGLNEYVKELALPVVVVFVVCDVTVMHFSYIG